jgi:hypothetical protein
MRVCIEACVDPRLNSASLTTTSGQLRSWVSRGIEYQQKLRKLSFGIVVLHVPRNKIVEQIQPGAVIHVPPV